MSKSKESGPPPALPEVCLLHLNFEPCPWCEPEAPDEQELLGEVEAAVVDTTPRRRGRPPKPRP